MATLLCLKIYFDVYSTGYYKQNVEKFTKNYDLFTIFDELFNYFDEKLQNKWKYYCGKKM